MWCEKGCKVHTPDLGLNGAAGECYAVSIRVEADAALTIQNHRGSFGLAAFERHTPQRGDRFVWRADQQMAAVPRSFHAADTAIRYGRELARITAVRRYNVQRVPFGRCGYERDPASIERKGEFA